MRTKTYALNRTKFLDELEQTELTRILKNFYARADRNALIVRVALATGARATELLNIRRQDLYENDKTVFIIGLKGSNDRELPLPTDLWDDLKIYAQTHANDRIFPISYTILHRMWGNMRPCKKVFHALRHTFALELYKRTKDIRLVQLALGHKNIANTEIYMSFVYSNEQMRRLICVA